MTNRRKLSITCSLLAGGVLVQAQTPPAPPAPPELPTPIAAPAAAPVYAPSPAYAPQPAAAPRPAAAPMPPMSPMPPPAFAFDAGDFDFNFDVHGNIAREELQDRVEAAREMAAQAREDARENMRLLGPEMAVARA